MTELLAPQTDRARWTALVVLCVGMLMIVLDATIVNVALPSIQEDLGFSQSTLAWVVNAYLISFGGLLLLSGRLGDLLGRRSVFLVGLGVFTTASLLCGLAQSQELLVAARFAQGVGGALASAVILGMIVTMFPEPREQAKRDRRVQLRRVRGRLDRPARGRRPDAEHQLALDLLREHPDRDRHSGVRLAPRRARQGHRHPRRRRRGRRGARHQRADARRLHDRRKRPITAGPRHTRSGWARCRWRCWPASWHARRPPATR